MSSVWWSTKWPDDPQREQLKSHFWQFPLNHSNKFSAGLRGNKFHWCDSGTILVTEERADSTEEVCKDVINDYRLHSEKIPELVRKKQCSGYIYSTLSSCLPTAGLIFSSTMKITIPLSSMPLLPARPDIWMYSPDVIYITWKHTRHSEEIHLLVNASL